MRMDICGYDSYDFRRFLSSLDLILLVSLLSYICEFVYIIRDK